MWLLLLLLLLLNRILPFKAKTQCNRKLRALLGLGPAYSFIAVHPNGEQMGKLAAMLGTGQLKVAIDRTFPLEQARCAALELPVCQA